MGGVGSGNRWRGKRDTCEANLRIDLRMMRKQGLLNASAAGTLSWSRRGEQTGWINYRLHPDAIELDYRTRRNGGPWHDINEKVPLIRIEQPFGGGRLYFSCLGCGQRCVILYGGSHFRCRTCQNLSYATQNEDRLGRLTAKSARIRERLGDEGGCDDPFPAKPKGMHWKTYERLRRQCDDLENHIAETFDGLLRKYGR